MTQVMPDQIGVSWSAVPVGLDREASGQIRIIASDTDARGVANQTVRVQYANRISLEYIPMSTAASLACQETLEWAYSVGMALLAEINLSNLGLGHLIIQHSVLLVTFTIAVAGNAFTGDRIEHDRH